MSQKFLINTNIHNSKFVSQTIKRHDVSTTNLQVIGTPSFDQKVNTIKMKIILPSNSVNNKDKQFIIPPENKLL